MNKEKKTAFTASTILALIGLTLMYSSIYYLGPEQTQIIEIDESMAGEPVEVEGVITNSYSTDEHLFFDLEDEYGAEIDIVMFNTDKSVENGEIATVIGDVSMYEGELNIIAEEIK